MNLKESEVKKAICYLKMFREDKNKEGIATSNMDMLLDYLDEQYEEQRMLNAKETDEMVKWSIENVK